MKKVVSIIVLLALISMSLVAPVPAAAETSPAPPVEAETSATLRVFQFSLIGAGGGTSRWSMEQQHTGGYSAKLVLPAPRTANDAAMVVMPSGTALSTFTDNYFGSFYFYKPSSMIP